ncbi:VOC family protein [Echinicola vietnamensis]|uniref:Lactoylglutathione lyase-like lyase n=1 Tax=Echinicola vietnamensis (strain DSM 17526 / LMG 23754 / KMM 6221) TaxID=926556 RepID=L0G2U9_ECHVK|nr:VOC family protein [Echinicola vietnamensis]AGA79326.1 lactoylglutathione lyase-like lyase [Echinicola vietnamensis DSM 17526]
MKFEHFAINVAQPRAMSDWYEKHIGLSVVSKQDSSPYMTFLADDSDTIMLEIYNNPKAPVLEFNSQHPLVLHLALVSEDPAADRDRLVAAGAEVISDDVLEDGSHLVMLKDPWGLALQLCKRAKPMLKL